MPSSQTIVPFCRLHLKGERRFRKLFRGEVVREGFEGIQAYCTFQDPVRREVDNFDSTTKRIGFAERLRLLRVLLLPVRLLVLVNFETSLIQAWMFGGKRDSK